MKLPKCFTQPARVFGKVDVKVPFANPSKFVAEGGLTVEQFLEFRGIEIPDDDQEISVSESQGNVTRAIRGVGLTRGLPVPRRRR